MSSRTEVIGRVADAVCARSTVTPDRAQRVAVDGITASGKTNFARELTSAVAERGRRAVCVSMDGFHNPKAVRYRQGRASAAGYYEDAYDFAALRTVLLDPLGPGGNGTYRTAVLDLATDVPASAPELHAVAGLVIVVDGSFLQKPDVRDGWDCVVYLRASFAAARERGRRATPGSSGRARTRCACSTRGTTPPTGATSPR